MLLFVSLSGMGFRTWFAGRVHDRMRSCAAAWAIGIVVNLVQRGLVGFLLRRERVAAPLRG